MSEIKKNIETCRGEDVLAEVSGLPQDPHFGSLVNEAFDPMQQQALHQAGYDGYSEVIEQHKPYTFASAIIQMKSNLLLLLRALWQFPFGAGTLRSLSDDASLRSLSDMWQHYITRLSGNETYGIPSRLSDLTDLPSAPLLVSDRKISGVPDAADGISLVHLTHSAQTITELTDNNRDWVMDRVFETSKYPNLTKLEIGAGTTSLTGIFKIVNGLQDLEEVTLHFKEITSHVASSGSQNWQGGIVTNCPKVKKINMPDAEKIDMVRTYGGETMLLFAFNPLLEEVIMPIVEYIGGTGNFSTNYQAVYMFDGSPNLKRLVFGKLTRFDPNCLLYSMTDSGSGVTQSSFQYLIDLEFGQGTAINLNLTYWSPTLDSSNLQQFLSNFRTYIALRLAAFDSNGPTLTLSQAVFSSIWDANGNPQVLGDGLDQLRADIHNIVKTTKHWDVNKAN